jgi:hypothetical protein
VREHLWATNFMVTPVVGPAPGANRLQELGRGRIGALGHPSIVVGTVESAMVSLPEDQRFDCRTWVTSVWTKILTALFCDHMDRLLFAVFMHPQ